MEQSRKNTPIILLGVIFLGILGAHQVNADAPTYAPDHLYATAASASQINLSWTAVADTTGYQVDRETPVGGGFTTILASHGALSYNDTGLAAGTTYRYRVAAVNASGTGPFSDSATNFVTTFGASVVAAIPSAPSNLTAIGVAGGVNLSWTATASDAPITGYRIEREVGGGFSLLVPDTGSAATTYGDSGLSLGVTYGYKVTAISSVGPSNPSQNAYGTVPIPPNTPPSATAVAGDGKATVSWFAASAAAGGVTGYVVAINTSTSPLSVASGTLSTTITGLTNGTSYYFSVSGVNAAGQGFALKTNTVTPVAALVVATSTPPPVATVPAPTPLPPPGIAPSPQIPPPPPPASTKFVIGDRAQTTANLNVRELASMSLSVILGMAPQGSQGTVIDGPRRDGYGSWWKINYDAGVDGWSLETYLGKVAFTSSPTPTTPPPVGSQLVLPSATFSRDLDMGSRGADVKALQEFLIGQNKGPVAEQLAAVGATGYFGTLTQKTLAEYQGSVAIAPAAGYFGPKTRNYVNTLKNR